MINSHKNEKHIETAKEPRDHFEQWFLLFSLLCILFGSSWKWPIFWILLYLLVFERKRYNND